MPYFSKRVFTSGSDTRRFKLRSKSAMVLKRKQILWAFFPLFSLVLPCTNPPFVHMSDSNVDTRYLLVKLTGSLFETFSFLITVICSSFTLSWIDFDCLFRIVWFFRLVVFAVGTGVSTSLQLVSSISSNVYLLLSSI